MRKQLEPEFYSELADLLLQAADRPLAKSVGMLVKLLDAHVPEFNSRLFFNEVEDRVSEIDHSDQLDLFEADRRFGRS